MKKFILKCVLLLGTFATASHSYAASGQLLCVNSSRGVCVVPIYNLYAGNVSKFGNILVAVKGVLREVDKRMYLFPTSESAKYFVAESAIELLVMPETKDDGLGFQDGDLVSVIGRIKLPSDKNIWADIELFSLPQSVAERMRGDPP